MQAVDYDRVPDPPNYREQDENANNDYYGQPKDYQSSGDYQDYQGYQPKQSQHPDYDDYGQPTRGGEEEYADYDAVGSAPRNSHSGRDYSEYEDYESPESRHDGQDHQSQDHSDKGYEDYFNSDGEQGNYFGQPFEDFFSKVENGIEDEIVSSPNYNQYGHNSPRARANYQPDDNNDDYHFDRVTFEDLSPETFDNNDPDTIDFQMPSHEDLQKNYKTVSTSASDMVERVVQFKPRIKALIYRVI